MKPLHVLKPYPAVIKAKCAEYFGVYRGKGKWSPENRCGTCPINVPCMKKNAVIARARMRSWTKRGQRSRARCWLSWAVRRERARAPVETHAQAQDELQFDWEAITAEFELTEVEQVPAIARVVTKPERPSSIAAAVLALVSAVACSSTDYPTTPDAGCFQETTIVVGQPSLNSLATLSCVDQSSHTIAQAVVVLNPDPNGGVLPTTVGLTLSGACVSPAQIVLTVVPMPGSGS